MVEGTWFRDHPGLHRRPGTCSPCRRAAGHAGGAGLGIACVAERWLSFGADLAAGRLNLSNLGRWWIVRQQGWAEMTPLLTALPGLLLSPIQVLSLAVSAATAAAPSDLYGKS